MNTPEENVALPQYPYPPAPIHQVEVVGKLWQVQFPQMCVKCGEAAMRTITVQKLFYRHDSEGPSFYLFGNVETPVCEPCFQVQAREQKSIPQAIRQRLLRRWLVEVLPFFFPFGCALWFLKIVIPLFAKSLVHHNHLWEVGLIGGICAVFGFAAWAFYNLAREKGKQLIYDVNGLPPDTYVSIERGPLGCRFIVPTEPTSIERAVDFTDDGSSLFDAERHLYLFENTAVAAKFAEINANRTWDPNAPQARRASKARVVVIAAVGIFFLYEVVMSLLGRG